MDLSNSGNWSWSKTRDDNLAYLEVLGGNRSPKPRAERGRVDRVGEGDNDDSAPQGKRLLGGEVGGKRSDSTKRLCNFRLLRYEGVSCIGQIQGASHPSSAGREGVGSIWVTICRESASLAVELRVLPLLVSLVVCVTPALLSTAYPRDGSLRRQADGGLGRPGQETIVSCVRAAFVWVCQERTTNTYPTHHLICHHNPHVHSSAAVNLEYV